MTLHGKVSETVAISIPPGSIHGETQANVVSSGDTVRMMLSGAGAGPTVILVRLMVRSNTSFKISGMFESTTAQLTQLSVIDVRATGRLVSPEAKNDVEVAELSDFQGRFRVLSGPRVSLGGSLNSPINALQITLLLRIKPQSTGEWLTNVTFFNH
ncbi:MAG TPA: hypothetical protein VJM50_17205 [Pyrinomonadaceae bacterium]|nr:hypothetical protein [Pyrinomonadaceae bacterium]